MIEITKYTRIGKGSIVGKFDIIIPKWGGFYIRDMILFQKGNAKWIGFPSKQYESEGQKKYFNYNGFKENTMLDAFQSQVMKALETHSKNDL